MKHSKMKRRMAIALSAALVVGCISFNAFAEDITEDIEIMSIDDEVSLDVDTFDLGVEELYVEDDFYVEEVMDSSDELFIPEDGEIIISDVVEIIDESLDESLDAPIEMEAAPESEVASDSESESVSDSESDVETDTVEGVEEEVSIELSEEMDTAEVEEMFAELQTTISLNYTEYTMTEVGETLILEASVNVPETEAAEEEVNEEVSVDTEEEFVSEEVVEFDNSVFWASSDETIVTVDEFGMVTAVAAGEAVVVCTLASDETVAAACVINVIAGCTLEEHVHSFEGCYVRELVCAHTSEDEHTYECFLNKFVCGITEHVHQEDCFNTVDKFFEEEIDVPEEVQDEFVVEEVTYEENSGDIFIDLEQ